MGSEQSCSSPSLSEQCIDRIFDNNYRYSTEISNPFEPFCERLFPRRKSRIIRLHQIRCDPDFDPNAQDSNDNISQQQLNIIAAPIAKHPRSASVPLNRNRYEIPLNTCPTTAKNQQKSQGINPMRKSACQFSSPKESQGDDNEEEEENLSQRGQKTPEAPRPKKGQEKEAETSFAGPTNTNCTVTETYPNGSVYHGNKVNNIRQGHGVLTFPNQACYKGQWDQDKMCGRGMFYYPSGQLAYQGQFARSSFEGFGYHFNEIVDYSLAEDDHAYYQDLNNIGGKWIKYEGEFFDDDRAGKGRLYMPNGDIIYGDFENNKLSGDSFLYKAIEKKIIKGYWEENKLVKLYPS